MSRAVPALTAVEAKRRAALIRVTGYDIAVDLTALPAGPQLRAVSTIAFECREPGAETFVECAAEVVRCTLNDRPLPAGDGGRIRLPDLAPDNVLRVESVQDRTAAGPGVRRFADPSDGEVYLWTAFEPDAARYAWACFDQPDLKAPYRLIVLAPGSWTVVGNTDVATVVIEGENRCWAFQPTPPLPTFAVTIQAGPFHRIRSERGGYRLGLFARRSLAGPLERDSEELFALTAQGLDFFGGRLAMPFPQRKYDQVFVPASPAAANFGCAVWNDALLHRAEPTPAERSEMALLLLRLLAQMWFGNIVTLRWWDDLWLTETLAEFAAGWAAATGTPYRTVWVEQLIRGKLGAYLIDRGPAARPIRRPASGVAEVLLDAKGASVLRQLMAHLGEETFTAGLATYVARHAWGSTTSANLRDALSASAGRPLDAWGTSWLDTSGPDRFALRIRDGAPVLVGCGPAGQPRPQTVRVSAYRWSGDMLERAGVAEVRVRDRVETVALPADAAVYLVNDDDLAFATTRSHPPLADSAARLPTPMARAVAVAEGYEMLTAGEIPPARVVEMLAEVTATELVGAMIEHYLRLAVVVATDWAPVRERADLLTRVAAAAWAAAERPGLRRIGLRAVAATAAGPEELDRLRKDADGEPDLHWRMLIRASEIGVDTTDEVDELLRRDTDPDASARALAVRAASPDPAEKMAVWQRMTGEGMAADSIPALAAAFWRPGQAELLVPFAARYLALLPVLHHRGQAAAVQLTRGLLPPHGVDANWLARAEREAEATAAPVVRVALAARADAVRRMLRARSYHRPGT